MINNGSAGRKNMGKGKAKGKGKMKMKEVEISSPPPPPPPTNLFPNLHGGGSQRFASPTIGASSQSQVQQILNSTAAPFDSFTALLAAAAASEEEDHHDPDLSADVENYTEEIDRIITSHCGNLRYALAGTCGGGVAEIAAAKKLMEKESEMDAMLKEMADMEKRAEHYKAEAEWLRERVSSLEQSESSLRWCLRQAIAARRYAETAVEDAQSSYVDPDRVAPVTLECKSCRRRRATVLVWPCCHVSVCTVCEATTVSCPVCRSLKIESVEVRLPLS